MYWIRVEGGKNVYEIRDRYKDRLNLQQNTWDEEFGWYHVNNYRLPLRKALNSFFLPERASNNPNALGDHTRSVIDYAWDYVKRKAPEFEGSCRIDARAAYFSGTNGPGYRPFPLCNPDDRKIELHMPRWDDSPAVRAGTILHEARHAAGYSHNRGENCPRGASCDHQYRDGRANTRQIQWLAQYYRRGLYRTTSMEIRALNRANAILKTGFTICPGVELDDDGYFVTKGDACD